VLVGINDIGFSELDTPCAEPNPVVTAAELIDGHRGLIRAARARGVTVVGATLTPFEGAGYYTEAGEQVRDAVNHWIRTGGEYDAVADLDRALADPDAPDRLRPEYDAGDRIHPNDAGYRAMAAAIDLDTLSPGFGAAR
jgi:lysophospholipase L1-like esterase